ncbi:UPF0262 family protein [Roseomonas sp. CCTCC AB2023176]|uniref:UPF0262 family protein n=1 Tax=Roseomonas sp. CCTCC AB2023176 TaxID=3342640 RepID=UPI0035E20A1C
MAGVATQRIASILLPEGPPLPSRFAEQDREQAVRDLLLENVFSPEGLAPGPYIVHLALRDGRLLLDIRDSADAPLRAFGLALGPFRRLIKDYQMVVGGYEQAVGDGAMEARIQTLDMARRGLHNEGAELLRERLQGRVTLDFETARRLFTLVCALHQRI